MSTQCLVGLHQQCQILFGRQSPHVHQGEISVVHLPLLTQCRRPLSRRIKRGVHPARQHLDILESDPTQFTTHMLGRHHGQRCLVVKFSQITNNRTLQPADAVMLAITVEIGSKIRTHRNFKFARRLQRGPAQGALGHDMHQVRPPHGPLTEQPLLCRQAHFQIRILGYGQSRGQHFLNHAHGRLECIVLLSRTDQLDLMIAFRQSLDKARQRQRDTVHLGRVGLRHNG